MFPSSSVTVSSSVHLRSGEGSEHSGEHVGESDPAWALTRQEVLELLS
ncbi:MAG: hypothetical protein AVDCRST_MAG48-2188 [uncultured Friedmanniella sp.]|uniref:Uncharacterized protein n=1 Tax=uncultured Friedmanniella sp. TaxID=335381 RepID=A0A6J4KQZ2_9ACTN|nr:MAG: hypothetical protein AVDCRST_MAG48-2188 [uncultured Friedmanniella sp.]